MNTADVMINGWGEWAFHASWQAAVAAATVAILIRSFRNRISAQFRYALLLVVLMKFAVPPFYQHPDLLPTAPVMSTFAETVNFLPVTTDVSSASYVNSSDTAGELRSNILNAPIVEEQSKNSAAAAVISQPSSVIRWTWLLCAAYFCGVAVWVAILLKQMLRIRQVVRKSTAAQDKEIVEMVRRISLQLEMRYVPEVRVSEDFDAPFATGILRPVIVVPDQMMSHLESDQLQIIIAHELVHVRRKDLITGWFEVVLSITWWFHPAMWWLKRSLRQTREDCCDDVLLARNVTTADRYCQTIIDAAAQQIPSACEPVALGFGSDEHAAGRRMRRLMDSSLLRSPRLKRPALILSLVLGLALLPGLQHERGPVTPTKLSGWFGVRDLPFKISLEEEEAVKECRDIANTWRSTRNSVRVFDMVDTQVQLEEILESHPGLFYAQHLLATWHQRNGDPEIAEHLFAKALQNAPMVLTIPYRLGNGKAPANARFYMCDVTCYRADGGTANDDLKLGYPGLVADNRGDIHMPVYQTVLRTHPPNPTGYRADVAEKFRFFKSEYHNGILPEVLVWKQYSKPRDFTRAADETSLLKTAMGTQTNRLTLDENDYVIASVARGQRNSPFVVEDGYGKHLSTAARQLPNIPNSNFMDHAVIDLSSPVADGFEISRIHVLDSQTKIPLHEFQGGAGAVMVDKHRFHLFSVADRMPEKIDLALEVYNYGSRRFQYVIPPRVGAAPTETDIEFHVTYLGCGCHNGWSSTEGFVGQAENSNTMSEIILRLTGTSKERFAVWTVLKDGRRMIMDQSFTVGFENGPERIYAALADIDHFEVLPSVEATTLHFEGLQLPERMEELDKELPVVHFQVDGLTTQLVSETYNPVKIRFRSRRGNAYSGISSNGQGVELHEQRGNQQELDSMTTIVWSANSFSSFTTDCLFQVDSTDGTNFPANKRSLSAASNDQMAITVDCRETPLEKLNSVTLLVSPRKEE